MSTTTIRAVTREEIPILEKYLGKKTIPWFHTSKLETQGKGEGLWLIAWKEDIPVGYIQVRWTGAKDQAVQRHVKNCVHLESAGVDEKFRGGGIGTKLIQEAERLAKEKGFTQIGMAVGSLDNPRARNLYEQLGYKDWEHGEFTTSWEYLDKHGHKRTESEVCIYLIKNL